MTLARLVRFELLALQAQRIVVLVLIGLACACTYAVSYGGNVNRLQVNVIDSLLQERSALADSLLRDLGHGLQISADTGFEGRSGITNLDDYVAVVAAKAPHPLQTLSIGQADVQPFQRPVSARSLFYDGGTIRLRGAQPEIRNAEKQLAGNFDLAFVVIYLVPLVVIALCYNALSDDMEFGTLALIRSSPLPVSRLVLTRVAVRTAVVSAIVVLSAVAAFLTTASGSGWDGAWWIGLALAYTSFWGMLAAAISAQRLTGGTSAMALLGAWLVSVILLPATISAIIDARHPVASRADLLSVARAKVETLWDAPRETTFGPFWVANPGLRRDTIARRPAYAEHFAVWHFNLTRLLAPVAAPYDHLVVHREQEATRLGMLSPALLTASALSALARSDLRSNLAYEDSLHAFQRRRALFADSLTFTAATLTPNRFRALEPWSLDTDYGASHSYRRAVTAIGLLGVLTLLLFLATQRGLRSVLG
jgi:ABC-2 type transport system permease protein